MTANELRQKYLDFFASKGHAVISSASLIPQNDPTVLFTTAGMHPLVPYLLGEKHASGNRLTDSQKCIRTTDIGDVGDNRHLTFFEMLGNWSLGDYFKKEALEWSWEFLTDKKWLGLDPKRLYVTVFMGNENAPQDEVAISEWQKQFAKAGIQAEVCEYNTQVKGNADLRIFPLPAKDNWWGPAGTTGPCGPCSEMFYDVTPEKGALQGTFDNEVDSFRIMEIWNDVFMEFNKTVSASFEKLAQQNVDTGMGLERTISVLNGKHDVFENELFYPLFQKLEELSGKKYGLSEEVTKAMRIVADHLKAATFILAEGLEPSNTERGYVLRRLIRRAVRYGRQLGIKGTFTFKISEVVREMYAQVYPELHASRVFIDEQLVREEERFSTTLEEGEKRLVVLLKRGVAKISGKEIFDLYQSYGFPVEMTLEDLKGRGVNFDEDSLRAEFENEMKKHQELSRTASAGTFKGGLADHSEVSKKYHTATHLLQAALRQILGMHVFQKGSNITAERMRFDFSQPEDISQKQLRQVEDLVNEKIKAGLPVHFEEMPLEKAKELGALGVFEGRYGEQVKVYFIGPSAGGGDYFSKEICGGPHVENTREIGGLKIVKAESIGQGVKRIKAVLV